MRIVHLSDLHLAKSSLENQKIILQALFDDLRMESANNKIDLIVFTGDLVAKGQYDNDTFDIVNGEFIKPMLDATGVSRDRLFIVPGNHDVNQKKRDPFYEPIFVASSTEDKVADLISRIEKDSSLLPQLEDFKHLNDKLMTACASHTTQLGSSYVAEINGLKIGIACMNSAWRASGSSGDKDYGQLLIGERQVDILSESIKNCDLKLALFHHPLEWLTTFDRPPVMRQIYSRFDAFMHGHNHLADAISIANSVATTFVSNAGCLYQSREYFNGYSIIDVAIQNDGIVWDVKVREYYDQRRAFDVSPRFSSEGSKKYKVFKGNVSTIVAVPTQAYLESMDDKVNSKLLSYVASSLAPKTIQKIFVEPSLSYVSEAKVGRSRDGEELVYLKLHELAVTNKTVLLFGRKESGKTTILSYLCTKANDPSYFPSVSHGFYVDISFLSRFTRASIIESIGTFCDGEYRKAEILDLLSAGKVVLCFDNLPANRPDVQETIEAFLVEFPKSKFFISAEERLEESVELETMLKLKGKCDVIFIHSFSRSQVRELVSRWMPENPETVQLQTTAIISSIKTLGVPKTPFLISIFLWIREGNLKFSPINHAAIIDTFIDGLLEKLSERKDRSSTDSTIKRDFLSQLAYAMHQEGNNNWTIHNLEKFTIAYFDTRALSISCGSFLDELFAKGILLKLDEYVIFKFDCFRSFLLAQVIATLVDFRNYALSGAGFLDLQTEIDFHTGLHRNQRDFLVSAEAIVDDLRRALGIQADLTTYLEISSHGGILQRGNEGHAADNDNGLIRALFGKKPTISEQNEALEKIDRRETSVVGGSGSTTNEQSLPVTEAMQPFANYIDGLKLSSAILRNSELVNDPELKARIYSKLIAYWSELLVWLLSSIDRAEGPLAEQLSTVFPNNGSIDHRWVAKVALPNVIFRSLQDSMGTGKLQRIVAQQLENEEQPLVVHLLSTIFYVDLMLDEYLDKLELLLTKAKTHRLTKEIIFFKLLELFSFRQLSDKDAQKVSDLAGRVFVDLNVRGTGERITSVKNAFIQRMRRPKLPDNR